MSAESTKQIKNRIKSIKGTMQITHAMQLVAASSMKKMTDRIEKSKPYFDTLIQVLDEISEDNLDFSSVFTQNREGKACHIVIAGDRGLAGGYNNNLFKSLNIGGGDMILPIGKKAVEYFSGREIFSLDFQKAADVDIKSCRELAVALSDAYRIGEFTSLYISYTRFKNMIEQEPETIKLLPLKRGDAKARSTKKGLTIYEPGAEEVFNRIVPYYLSGVIYGAVTESVTSETAARRNSMEAATDNAKEMLDRLTLDYNRARQSAVTQELTEIISGTEI